MYHLFQVLISHDKSHHKSYLLKSIKLRLWLKKKEKKEVLGFSRFYFPQVLSFNFVLTRTSGYNNVKNRKTQINPYCSTF